MTATTPPPSEEALHAPQQAPQARLGRRLGSNPLGSESVSEDDEIDLAEYWRIILHAKGMIALIAVLSVCIGLFFTINTEPLYQASTLIQIDRISNQVVEYGDVTGEGSLGRMNDPEFYNTQYELLKSRRLARRVIDQLSLPTSGEAEETDGLAFLGALKDGLKVMLMSLSTRDLEARKALQADREQARRQREEDQLLKHLTISPVRNSQLVRVEFASPEPKAAAVVANAIAEVFIRLNLERRHEAAADAKIYLQEQLEQTRASLEASEQRLIAYSRARQIVSFEDRLEILRNQLREMSTHLVKAEAARFAAESEYQELLAARAGGAPSLQDSELIRALKLRRSELQASYQEQLEVLKPAYPSMQELQRQIGEIDAEIKRETQAIRDSLRATFQARLREEAKLKQRIQEAQEEALLLQDRTTDYAPLQREVQTNRALYDGLLQRLKEVDVAAGVGENNISVIDAATIPLQPFKPSLRNNLAIATAIGLLLGVALAFLRDSLNNTVKSADQLERRLGAPVLGLIPRAPVRDIRQAMRGQPLLARNDPSPLVAEALRSLRTALLLSTARPDPRLFHFTSAHPGAGTTSTAVNTAIAFALAGEQVLLIDANLRHPGVHSALGLANTTGLTSALVKDGQAADFVQPTQVPGLYAITSGPPGANPADLLASAKLPTLLDQLGKRFARILIDSPPVLDLADALLLANLMEATILVAEPNRTRTHDLQAAILRLYQAGAPLLGTVLNKIEPSGRRHGYHG